MNLKKISAFFIAVSAVTLFSCSAKEDTGKEKTQSLTPPALNSDGETLPDGDLSTSSADDPITEKEMNASVLADFGLTSQEISAKYGSHADSKTYVFASGEYENLGVYDAFGVVPFGVVQIRDIKLEELFPNAELGTSVEKFASDYGLRFVSNSFSGMQGTYISLFFKGGYTIALINTENGITSETYVARIELRDYWIQVKCNVTTEELKASKVQIFLFVPIYGISQGLTVEEFFEDPVIKKVFGNAVDNFCFMLNNEIVESGVITMDMILVDKTLPLETQFETQMVIYLINFDKGDLK